VVRDNGPVPPSAPGPSAPEPLFAPEPPRSRVFEGARAVRATDADASGRLRLDGLARFLQDIAEDDVAGAGWQRPYGWLLRRCAVTVRAYPRVTERVTLRTFCSGTGPRWVQRTTTVARGGRPVIQAVALWVAVDRATGQPCALGEDFTRVYGEAAGRRVSARLELPAPVPGVPGRDWPVRAADLDTAGHVNNTVYWAVLEDVIAAGLAGPPGRALLEYHRPVLPGDRPVLRAAVTAPSPGRPGHTSAWLTDAAGAVRYASARLSP
jgi:acyl-ACP thioesterase